MMRFRITYKQHFLCEQERMYRYACDEVEAESWSQAVAIGERWEKSRDIVMCRVETMD